MTDYKEITFTIEDNLAVLTLNAPDRLNALSSVMLQEICTALRSIQVGNTHGVRALLLTGSGRAFSAGADLSGGAMRDAGSNLMDDYHPLFLELAGLDIPVIAAVNGVAAGAGMSLAISADIVFAAKSAYFLQAFVNIGLVPDAGSSYLLPRLVGPAKARAMMMLGEKVPAETAEQWGLVYQVLDDDTLMDTAMAAAQKMAHGPTVALSHIRKMVQASLTNGYADQLQLEAIAQRKCSVSSDAAEGVSAFLQKRAANFTGK